MNYLKQLFVSISNLPKNLFSAAPDEVSVPIEIEDTISRKRRRDPEDDVMEINQSPVKRSHLVTGSKVLRESCMNYSNLQKTAGTQTYGNVLLPTKSERSSSDGLQKTVDNWNSVIDDDITTWSPKQFKNKFKAPKHVRSPNKHSKSNPKAHDGTAMISIDLTSPEKTRPSTTMIASRGIFDSTRVSPKSQLFNEKQSFDDFQRLLCELLSYDTKESMKKPTAPPRIAETVDLTDETIDLTGSAALQVKPLQTSRRIGAPTVTVNPNFSFGNDDRSSSIARETTTPRSLVPRLNSFEETLNKNKYTSHVFVDLTTERYKNYLDAVKVEDERCQAKLECQKRINSTNIDELITNRLLEHCKITESSILIEDEEEKEIETVKPELTNEMMVKIRNAWNERLHPRETLVSKFKLDVTRSDLMTLKNLNWLNDAVINFYMELIAERGDSDPKYPSVYAFSTFFYPTLTKGYDRVRRYTRKVDLFSKDIILVPIHLAVHWCMAKIDMKKKKIFYYDSMKASNQKALDTLLDYLVQEHIDKKKEKFDSSEWDIINDKDIPCQRNGSDCGVFACTFGEYSARNSKFNFSQDDMQYMRQKMVVEILEGRLLL